jgi:hypothetical protein
VSLPPDVLTAAETALNEFCNRHSLAAIADQLRYTYQISGTTVMLIEQRPGFMNPAEWNSLNVAKFRYSPAKGQWSLYWSEGNDRWRRLSSAPASPDLAKLLQTVADDASGVFSK